MTRHTLANNHNPTMAAPATHETNARLETTVSYDGEGSPEDKQSAQHHRIGNSDSWERKTAPSSPEAHPVRQAPLSTQPTPAQRMARQARHSWIRIIHPITRRTSWYNTQTQESKWHRRRTWKPVMGSPARWRRRNTNTQTWHYGTGGSPDWHRNRIKQSNQLKVILRACKTIGELQAAHQEDAHRLHTANTIEDIITKRTCCARCLRLQVEHVDIHIKYQTALLTKQKRWITDAKRAIKTLKKLNWPTK